MCPQLTHKDIFMVDITDDSVLKEMKKAILLCVPIQQISGYAAYLQTKLQISTQQPTIDQVKQNLKQS